MTGVVSLVNAAVALGSASANMKPAGLFGVDQEWLSWFDVAASIAQSAARMILFAPRLYHVHPWPSVPPR
jgi:hypothetical protein